MNNKLIRNNSELICYYSIKEERYLEEDEACRQTSVVNILTYKDYLDNGLNTLRSPGTYKYFEGVASIPPRTNVELDRESYNVISNIDSYKIHRSYTIDDLKECVKELSNKYSNKTFAVELSGGLDSSLVIECLLNLGIEPVLIGYTSKEFEFRTERNIQEYYTKRGYVTELLDMDDYPLFVDLTEIPKHPVPSSPSLWFRRHQIVAEIAKKHGVNIVLSGEAGDQLFSLKNETKDGDNIPLQFGYWGLSQTWINQYVYKKLNMSYVSALALGAIPSILLSLRNLQDFDPMKLWARNYFKYCLPSNLSEYAYTAFFDGWFMKGLKQAVNEIEEISHFSYDLTGFEGLNPGVIKYNTLQYGQLSEQERKLFLLNITYAAWLYSNRN